MSETIESLREKKEACSRSPIQGGYWLDVLFSCLEDTVERIERLEEAMKSKFMPLSHQDFLKKMDVHFKTIVDDIIAQREEIAAAFLAKYGCEPDEAVQCIRRTGDKTEYWIEKRDE